MAIIGIFMGLILLMAGVILLAALAMPLLGLAAMLLLVSLGTLSFVFWIWMLVDCIKNDRISGNEKIAWVVAIALTHWLGALIYFLAARKQDPAFAQPPPLARI